MEKNILLFPYEDVVPETFLSKYCDKDTYIKLATKMNGVNFFANQTYQSINRDINLEQAHFIASERTSIEKLEIKEQLFRIKNILMSHKYKKLKESLLMKYLPTVLLRKGYHKIKGTHLKEDMKDTYRIEENDIKNTQTVLVINPNITKDYPYGIPINYEDLKTYPFLVRRKVKELEEI